MYLIKSLAVLIRVSLISAIVCACAPVGPDYQKPEIQLPSRWRINDLPTLTQQSDAGQLTRWWLSFNDPLLAELITLAAKQNWDVQQAQARVREARAKNRLAKAQLFPALTGNAGVSQTESSREAGLGTTTELFSNSIDASWELDIFGKKRRDIESKTATQQAADEDLRDVLVSLYAEIALSYVELRSYQARLATTESNAAAQQETYQLTEWRYQAGLTTQLDVEQAKFNKESTQSDLPSLREGLIKAQQALAVLVGLQPQALMQKLAQKQPIPVVSKSIAFGIPADILRQRPDVRKAERQLAAQTAQIGVAKAAKYPNLNLTGSLGLEALALGSLYTAGAKMFQITAASAWTLLDAGRIQSNIDVQQALQEQALGVYQAAVLTGLKEVEQALTAFQQEQDRIVLLRLAVSTGRDALELAQFQYQSGINDFQPVLTAQKSLLTMQINLIASEAKLASDAIRLYKALGGGWTNV
ncbi:MAG: efflux transporter outer membrane subunit [Methylovulum sp.]|nr:efflux transporter outer membrane subunit [Methylovulum sp.]